MNPSFCFVDAASSAQVSGDAASSGATLNVLLSTAGLPTCWSSPELLAKVTRSSIAVNRGATWVISH
jgi:hypothetical protein